MIRQDKFFDERVHGHISAELELDENGKPISIRVGRLNLYKIRLRVITENPMVRRVVYHLDPTCYDPVRESDDRHNGFPIETTTYGDLSLLIDVQVGVEIVRRQAMVSQLLKETYKESSNALITEAIEEILCN